MARPKKDIPTDRETEILRILWRRGPCTAREVLDELNEERRRKIAYSSVQTVLTIMFDKGFVDRDDSERSHVFSAAQDRDEVEAQLIRHLARTAFGGSTMRLVTRALAVQETTPEEAEQIQLLLRELEADDDRGV